MPCIYRCDSMITHSSEAPTDDFGMDTRLYNTSLAVPVPCLMSDSGASDAGLERSIIVLLA